MSTITHLVRSPVLRQQKVFRALRQPLLYRFQRSNTFRSFHASPRRQFLEPVLLGTHSVLEAVHSLTGTPWALTIPLSALVVRLTILLPFTLYQRSLLRKQISLTPLISGWAQVIKKQTYVRMKDQGPAKATIAMNKDVRAKQREILKRWGCQRWKTSSAPLLQLPVWLVMTETIRRMCGVPEGLLGMAARRLEQFGVSGTQAAPTAAELTGLFEAPARVLGVESSFANEGALWFPDLLVADPQLILPFMLSGAILLNLFGKTPSSPQVLRTKWQIRLTRSLGVVAIVIAPLTLQVPSAMLVYWVSSATLGYLQSALLDRLSPMPKSITWKLPKQPLMTPEGLPNTSSSLNRGGKTS